MINRWRMVLLGVVISHGAGLVAMNQSTNSLRNPLSCSTEARKTGSGQLMSSLKRSVELHKEEKNKSIKYGCGTRYIMDQQLAEMLKNDPRIGWLPI